MQTWYPLILQSKPGQTVIIIHQQQPDNESAKSIPEYESTPVKSEHLNATSVQDNCE